MCEQRQHFCGSGPKRGTPPPGRRPRPAHGGDRGRRRASLVTLAVSVLPELKFAYRSDEAHVAIETAAFLVPALAAILFGGRAVRARSRTDLLLACSLTALAATNLSSRWSRPWRTRARAGSQPGHPQAAACSGAVGFAAAALLPDRRLVRPRRALALGLVWTGRASRSSRSLAAVFGDDLPRGLDADLSPENAEEPAIEGHALVLVRATS